MAGFNGILFLPAAALCLLIAGGPAGFVAQETIDPQIESAVNVFRLPENVHPLHYKLRIVTHLGDEEGFKFTGKVSIKVSI